MTSPQRSERRDIRYPLQLPVSLMLAHKEMHTRSENISLGGILLSSAFLILEGSPVEVAVGVAHLPDPGMKLTARGRVVRVQPKPSGDFAVAIAFERPLELCLQGLCSRSGDQGKGPRFSDGKKNFVASRWPHFAPAWHTET